MTRIEVIFMEFKEISEIIKELDYKYYILDMMNNNIISSMYKEKLLKEINFILDTLKKIAQ